MEPRNYIELPQHGIRLCTPGQPLVILAEKLGTVLRVIEPLNFRMSWPVVRAEGWMVVNAPVGEVTVEEWRELVGL